MELHIVTRQFYCCWGWNQTLVLFASKYLILLVFCHILIESFFIYGEELWVAGNQELSHSVLVLYRLQSPIPFVFKKNCVDENYSLAKLVRLRFQDFFVRLKVSFYILCNGEPVQKAQEVAGHEFSIG